MKTYSIVLERGKCFWGKCYFCGWGKKVVERSIEEVKRIFDKFISSKRDIERLKIFSSGSFLDPKQFPEELQDYIFRKADEYGIKEIIIESRPEFITENTVSRLSQYKVKITVAMGLEVADNEALKILNKGMTVEQYIRAATLLKKYGLGVRTYVLVNPHSKIRSPEYVHKTIEFALKYSDSIVVINTYPHKNSDLWEDWINGKWRPLDKTEFEKTIAPWKDNPKIEFDFDNFAFIPKFPPEKRIFLRGVGHEYLRHPYYEVWQDFFQRFYIPPAEKEYVLFLPCAYRKPYTKSKTWKSILRAIAGYPFFKKLHLIAVSSPGVIPYEFIKYYPFANYDWPEWEETEEIKKEYIEVTKDRVLKYVKAHLSHYKEVYFAYLKPDSESMKAIRLAFDELKKSGINVKLIECFSEETYSKLSEVGLKNPVAQPDAIEDLKRCLKSFFEKN
ncbi:MAG: radical SAM protein [Candidatus Asgardarchaeia archaeon]